MTLSAVARAAYLKGGITSLAAFDSFDSWFQTLSTGEEFMQEVDESARASIWDDWDVGLGLGTPEPEPEGVAPSPYDVFNELELDLGLVGEAENEGEATATLTEGETQGS